MLSNFTPAPNGLIETVADNINEIARGSWLCFRDTFLLVTYQQAAVFVTDMKEIGSSPMSNIFYLSGFSSIFSVDLIYESMQNSPSCHFNNDVDHLRLSIINANKGGNIRFHA